MPTRFSLTVHHRKEKALANILPSHCPQLPARSLHDSALFSAQLELETPEET